MVIDVLVGVQLILDLLVGQITSETMATCHRIIQVMIRHQIRVLGLVLADPMGLIEHGKEADEEHHHPAHFRQTREPTRHFRSPLVWRHGRIVGP